MQIVLVDDEPCIRSALRLLLEDGLGCSVVGEVTEAQALASLDAPNALAALAAPEGPDLLVVDWELPGLDPAQLARLREQCRRLKVIALSGRPEAGPAALAAGVDAFLYRGDPPDRVVSTLRTLAGLAAGEPPPAPDQPAAAL